MASQSSALQPSRPHLHVAGEVCPWCEQPIPHEKFAEISERIEAREREHFSDLTARLREQFDAEKAEFESGLNTQLEKVRVEGVQAAEKLKAEAALAVQTAREEATRTAEAAALAQRQAAEQDHAQAQEALSGKVAEAEAARSAAEASEAGLKEQIQGIQQANNETLKALKVEAATREAAARDEGRIAAEAVMDEKLAEAERLKAEAIAGVEVKLTTVQQAKEAADQRVEELKASHEAVIAERVQEVREALEKAKDEAVNAEKAKAFGETLKLTETVQDLQRQLERKTNEELGEGAEIDLHEALKAEFPDDRIDRVGKGESGADIVHVIIHNGQECGRIVYDSKNRGAWRNDYVTKLAQDQMAAKAEHAILSTRKFPANTRQLCIQDGIILANPARVVALVELLRRHIVQTHTLRLSSEARVQKTAMLYDFITSERCSGLFGRIDTDADDLLDLDAKEVKAHNATWKRRGELVRSVQRVRVELTAEIDRIIGTARPADQEV